MASKKISDGEASRERGVEHQSLAERGGQGGQLVVTAGVDETGFVIMLSETRAAEVNESFMVRLVAVRSLWASLLLSRVAAVLYAYVEDATCLKRFNGRTLIFRACHDVDVWTLSGS